MGKIINNDKFIKKINKFQIGKNLLYGNIIGIIVKILMKIYYIILCLLPFFY